MTPVSVTVYSRSPCELCEEAMDAIERGVERVDRPVEVEVVDVDADPALRAEYGERVPYVFVEGTPRFKYRVDETDLVAALERA